MKKLFEKVQEDIKIYQFPEIKNHALSLLGFSLLLLLLLLMMMMMICLFFGP